MDDEDLKCTVLIVVGCIIGALLVIGWQAAKQVFV